MLSSDKYVINKYMFPSIPEAVNFYTENRLEGVYLEEPVIKSCAIDPITIYTPHIHFNRLTADLGHDTTKKFTKTY